MFNITSSQFWFLVFLAVFALIWVMFANMESNGAECKTDSCFYAMHY